VVVRFARASTRIDIGSNRMDAEGQFRAVGSVARKQSEGVVRPVYSPKANTKGASTDEATGPWYSAPPAYEHRPPRQGDHRRSALPAASQQLAMPPMHSSHGTKSGSRSGLRTRVPLQFRSFEASD